MALLRIFSLLPLPLLYAFSDLLFVVGFYLLRYRRKVIMSNLVNAFPNRPQTELNQIEKTFFRNLCDYSVETLKLLTINRDELKLRMVFKNPDSIREYTDHGQSVLFLASHQFNWEWLLASGCLHLPVPVDFVFQPQKSALANRFSLAIRTRFGAHPVEREKVGREALKRKGIVRGTAIVADQFPGHFNHRRYWTTFLSQRTAFFHGLAQLGTLTQSAVYFASISRKARGHYVVELIKIAAPPYDEQSSLAIITNYVAATEKIIHREPDGWLWSHRRWKATEE